MERLYITSTPTRRGKELSKILNCSYNFIELDKYSNLELILYIHKITKRYSHVHAEIVNNLAFFIILRIFKFFSRKLFVFDCHMVIFSKDELSTLRFNIYRLLLKKQKLVFHNDTIATNQKLTDDFMTMFTPVSTTINASYLSRYTIGILSNNYNDISESLLNRIIALDFQVFMSGNVPEKFKQHDHVHAPGRLDFTEYMEHALSCDVIVGLSDREDCLVLVGREFLFYNKKVIVSDTKANRDHYSDFVEYLSSSDTESVIQLKIAKALNSGSTASSYQQIYKETCQNQYSRYNVFVS